MRMAFNNIESRLDESIPESMYIRYGIHCD